MREIKWSILLIGDEAPEVHLQIVSVDLDLLEAVTTEGPQTNTLEEGLKHSCRLTRRVVTAINAAGTQLQITPPLSPSPNRLRVKMGIFLFFVSNIKKQ